MKQIVKWIIKTATAVIQLQDLLVQWSLEIMSIELMVIHLVLLLRKYTGAAIIFTRNTIVPKLRRYFIFFTGQTNNHSRIPNADEVENFPPEGRPVPTNQFKVNQTMLTNIFDEFIDNVYPQIPLIHTYLDLILFSHM